VSLAIWDHTVGNTVDHSVNEIPILELQGVTCHMGSHSR